MRSFRPSAVSLDSLLDHKNKLLKLEELTVIDIKDIYLEEGDIEYTDEYLIKEDLPYKWSDPLYMKMIHRYRNCGKRIAVFYHQVDPLSQWKVTASESIHSMVEFFAWISNMLGIYQINDILGDDATEDKLQEWEIKPIKFFYSLTKQQQTTMINEYNRIEVEG